MRLRTAGTWFLFRILAVLLGASYVREFYTMCLMSIYDIDSVGCVAVNRAHGLWNEGHAQFHDVTHGIAKKGGLDLGLRLFEHY